MRSKKKTLSSIEIGEKVRQGQTFTVTTSGERKKALAAAAFLGLRVTSRKNIDDNFLIFPLEPTPTKGK